MSSVTLDRLVLFAISILWRATAVTYLTQFVAAMAGMRWRCLAGWLRKLLAQADPSLESGMTREAAMGILRHPMIGSAARCGDFVTRDQLVAVLGWQTRPEELARLEMWFDHAMKRATRDYRRRAGVLSALAALGVTAATVHDARSAVVVWVLLSLGSPFWYDLLKRVVPVLRK